MSDVIVQERLESTPTHEVDLAAQHVLQQHLELNEVERRRAVGRLDEQVDALACSVARRRDLKERYLSGYRRRHGWNDHRTRTPRQWAVAARTGAPFGHLAANALDLRARHQVADARCGREDRQQQRLRTRPGSRVEFTTYPGARGEPFVVPDRLWRLDTATALAAVTLPQHLHWSGPSRPFNLRDRRDRARVYEIVLREGEPADLLAYLDGALLVDLWDDLVIPRAVCGAWEPLITSFGAIA